MFIHANGFYWDTLGCRDPGNFFYTFDRECTVAQAARFGQRYTFRRVRKRKEFQLISLSQFQVEFEKSLLFPVNFTDHLQSKRGHVETLRFLMVRAGDSYVMDTSKHEPASSQVRLKFARYYASGAVLGQTNMHKQFSRAPWI